ncbi:MAG TPA: hypothetical protein VF587_03085 [Solirubrobacteraceae bacterium]|jgi:hypothetical protein
MSQTASRPWWADVQHLRPDEDGGNRSLRTGRFERPTARPRRGDDHRPARRREPEVWLDASLDVPVEKAKPEPKPERRTIEIRGQVDRVHGVAPVSSPGPQRVRGRRAHERVGPRPDKVAMWAVILGLLLILVAAISSPGADAAAILLSAGL